MDERNEPSAKREVTGLLGHLGAARITAIGTCLLVALTILGYLVGHATTPAAAPGPTVTVTVTVAPPRATPTSSSAQPTSPASRGSSSSNGTHLGSYSLSITDGYSVPSVRENPRNRSSTSHAPEISIWTTAIRQTRSCL